MFLRNRSVNVKIVKDQKASPESPEEIIGNIEAAAAYAEIFKNVVTHTALVVGGVWCVCKVVERLCR